jgi:hypothetical protein
VTWNANRERRTQGQPPSDQKSVSNQQQSFWFQTDSNPPDKLAPWILVALPGEAEQHYFTTESIKVVFATNNLGEMYAAYNKKLQARLRPASFVPVPSTAVVPHPFPINASSLKPVKASVLSPWEDAIQKLVTSSLPCVTTNGERTRHSSIDIPIPLDPYTDYLLDIEMLDSTAADGSSGQVIWRGSFSTGGFQTASQFAQAFQIARVNHRGVHSDDVGKLQAISTTFLTRNPEGAELDTALAGAGLDSLPVSKVPAVTVFWDPSTPQPQPAAILVDSPEPMWRQRQIPTQVTDPPPTAAQRYVMAPQPWLTLEQQAGGDDVVDHVVPAPGGQRALVTLKPNSRGKHIKLALRRVAHTEAYLDGASATDQFYALLDSLLNAAPWEEVS